jgi:hypothetical protein
LDQVKQVISCTTQGLGGSIETNKHPATGKKTKCKFPPDLRIIPRPQQQQNGARAQNKTRQVATSSIEGESTSICQKIKTCNKLSSDKVRKQRQQCKEGDAKKELKLYKK